MLDLKTELEQRQLAEKERENGTIISYELEECKKCDFEYFILLSYKSVNNKMVLRKKCFNCGNYAKETITCYDYGFLLKFFTDRTPVLDGTYALLNPEEEEFINNNIKENICNCILNGYNHEEDKNCGQYEKFCKEWLKNHIKTCDKYHYQYNGLYKEILKLDTYSFAAIFSQLFFYMWN